MVTNIPHPPPPRITTARICFPNLHLCLRFQAEIRYTCKLQTDQNSTTSIMKSGSSALFPNHLVRDSPSEVIQPVLHMDISIISYNTPTRNCQVWTYGSSSCLNHFLRFANHKSFSVIFSYYILLESHANLKFDLLGELPRGACKHFVTET